ncbi:MAG TPA: Hsp20/alpha crystallin family protein [Bryobacteraceae bacterium]|nr:Hsp20/alpha crystallin family protein [Bryobacteraceae bacterium]
MSSTDPYANLRVFEDAFTRMLSEPRTNRPWSPPVDVFETDNELVFKADLPGLSSSEIDVRVENQTLTIAGERKFDKQEDNRGFHRIERSYGNFVRSFAVPNTFDTEKIAAAYKEGVLTVTLAKKEAAKPRQVKVEVSH